MKVTVKVPATSANVGPAFDCAGFAVNLYNEITVERKLAKPFSSREEGEFSGEASGFGKNNFCAAGGHAAGADDVSRGNAVFPDASGNVVCGDDPRVADGFCASGCGNVDFDGANAKAFEVSEGRDVSGNARGMDVINRENAWGDDASSGENADAARGNEDKIFNAPKKVAFGSADVFEVFNCREIRLFTDANGTLEESFDLELVQKTKNEFFKKIVEKFSENGQNPLFLADECGAKGQNGDFSGSVKDSGFVNVDFACEKNADFLDDAGVAEGFCASDCEKAGAARVGVTEQNPSPSNILYEKDFSDSVKADFDGASAEAFDVAAGRDGKKIFDDVNGENADIAAGRDGEGAGVAENSAIRGASGVDENKKLVGTGSKAADIARGRDVSDNVPGSDVVNRENAVFCDASVSGSADFSDDAGVAEGFCVSDCEKAGAARVGGCDFVPETFEITVKTNVPPARGLGSSATIIVGVLKGLNALYGNVLTDRELAEAATAVEGHPDNVVPALFGGFVFSFAQDDGKVDFSRHNFISGVKIFALIPDFELKTSVSRGVLPKMIKYETAVYNLKQTAELFAALTKNDKALFSKALHDKLHQPYREKCIPGMSELIRQIPCAAGVLGCVLSGAGPTLAVFSEGGRIELEKIAGDVWQRSGIKFEIKELEPDNEGATVIFDE